MLKKIKTLKAMKDSDGKDIPVGSIVELDEASYKSLVAGSYEDYAEGKAVGDDIAVQIKAAVKEGVEAEVKKLKVNKLHSIHVTHDPADDGFKSFGEQLLAVKEAGKSDGRVVDKRLLAINAAVQKATGLSEGMDSEGGFLLQPTYAEEVFKLAHDTGVLMRKCNCVPIGANSNSLVWNALKETSRADGNRRGGISVYRTNEATTKTASKTAWERREMRLEKLAGVYYATDELLQDATALSSEVSSWFGEEFGFKTDDEIVRGTGAGQMLGVLNSAALVSVSKETNQAATTLLAQNVIKMYARMYAPSMARAEWYINQDILPQLFTLSIPIGTAGALLYMPANGLSAAPYGTLFGRPVNVIEQAATLGTQGDILFMDLSQYKCIEKGGVEAASSIHLKFLEDETAFRFVVRNNGQPNWRAPLTPAQGSNTVSPFVALNVRA